MKASVLMKIHCEHCKSQLQETRQKYPLAMEEEKIPLQLLKAAEVYKALIKLSHHSIKCLETITSFNRLYIVCGQLEMQF